MMRERNVLIILILAAIALTINPEVSAQYHVFDWFNFESGELRKGAAKPIGRKAAQTVKIVNYDSIFSFSSEFRNDYTKTHLGSYGLELLSIPADVAEDYMTGLSSGIVLDRRKLGQNGKALFQADFFIPQDMTNMPSLAVLAMKPLQPGEVVPKSIYRFGMTRQTTIYFSLMNADTSLPTFSKVDAEMTNQLPRGYWHRFAIVFEGQSTIRCFIDGREAQFSPFSDNSLQQLQVGILLADNKKSYKAYADNLSIQWTRQNVPLPESPWEYSWTGAAKPLQIFEQATEDSRNQLTWKEANTAYNEAEQSGRPLLVYFYAPNVSLCNKVDKIFAENASAHSFLNRYSLTKINTNQLQGGEYAGKFNIFKVPTLIVMNPSGQVQKKIVISRTDEWNDIQTKIESAN